jgi:hypothetical protein
VGQVEEASVAEVVQAADADVAVLVVAGETSRKVLQDLQ